MDLRAFTTYEHTTLIHFKGFEREKLRSFVRWKIIVLTISNRLDFVLPSNFFILEMKNEAPWEKDKKKLANSSQNSKWLLFYIRNKVEREKKLHNKLLRRMNLNKLLIFIDTAEL